MTRKNSPLVDLGDHTPVYHASGISKLYGMTRRAFEAAVSKGDIKVGRLGGALVDTPANARAQVERMLKAKAS